MAFPGGPMGGGGAGNMDPEMIQQQQMIKFVRLNITPETSALTLETDFLFIDAKHHGILSWQDRYGWRHGFRTRRRLRPLHVFDALRHTTFLWDARRRRNRQHPLDPIERAAQNWIQRYGQSFVELGEELRIHWSAVCGNRVCY